MRAKDAHRLIGRVSLEHAGVQPHARAFQGDGVPSFVDENIVPVHQGARLLKVCRRGNPAVLRVHVPGFHQRADRGIEEPLRNRGEPEHLFHHAHDIGGDADGGNARCGADLVQLAVGDVDAHEPVDLAQPREDGVEISPARMVIEGDGAGRPEHGLGARERRFGGSGQRQRGEDEAERRAGAGVFSCL